jgi:putative PIN family toxin of toxin-antitoxin system
MSILAVFDCMLFLQAVTNEAGPAFACFRFVEEGKLTLCLSPEILAEVKDVLARPKLRRKFASLTEERVDEFLRTAAAKAVVLDNVPQAFAYARDPDDEPYINLAIAAGARYLVSRENDLLDLMTIPEFLAQCPGLTVIDPVVLIRELRPPATS